VKARPSRRKAVKPTKVDATKSAKPLLKQTTPRQRPYVLVYAGDYTAFAIREFRTWESLARHMAEKQLRRDECAVIQGRVLRCTPAYRDKLNPSAADLNDDESAELLAGELTTTNMSPEDVARLIGN
jgi:hypothetical protein